MNHAENLKALRDTLAQHDETIGAALNPTEQWEDALAHREAMLDAEDALDAAGLAVAEGDEDEAALVQAAADAVARVPKAVEAARALDALLANLEAAMLAAGHTQGDVCKACDAVANGETLAEPLGLMLATLRDTTPAVPA